MIVVDASAVLAIYLNEPERGRFNALLEAAPERVMSPINYWEVTARAFAIDGQNGVDEVTTLIDDLGIVIADIGRDVTALAVEALMRFGGRPARLNLGDCFAYALAKSCGAPLLFKGGDFTETDVAVA